MTDISSLRAAFVDTLTASGYLRDEKWLAAFREIPRGPFVPYYFTQTPDHSGWIIVESTATRWAEGAYSNGPLITQLDGDDTLTDAARRGQLVNGVSTSSSSAPSLMALMLDALDVDDGHTILEIGTGTGYNTALLCHRVGADQVTSIDIDPGMVHSARQRLATFGYHPHLAILDGTAGCAARAPFDRVIATVAVPSVPQEWIGQTRAGGVILLPLDRRNCGGLLVRLTVQPGGTAQGRFLSDFGGFMPVRPIHRRDAADRAFRAIDNKNGDARRTSLPANFITEEASPVEFFVALTAPGGGWNNLTFTPDNGGPTETWLAQGDGSWVCHTTAADGTHTVRQGGPTRFWDHVETAYHHWRQIGRPTRDRFGLTIHNRKHVIWLDHPHSPHQWTLPT
ncbi:MAG: ATP-grasp peptide maturase system methyltransferase [Sciscionella sp.]